MGATGMTWYKRSGQRTTERAVQAAKDSYVAAKRQGRMGELFCAVNEAAACSVEHMTLREFANWSGMFTYRTAAENRRSRNALARAKNQILRDLCGTSARAAREDMGM